MSKVDAMQAMREARYAARSTPSTTTARPAPVVRRKAGTSEAPPPEISDSVVEPAAMEEVLCGHRSMNNRICKRPAGHPEKNHRYN